MTKLKYSTLHLMMKHCSVLAVLSAQMHEYEETYGSKPQMIIMHRNLKGAIVREVFQRTGEDPTNTVIEPVWIGEVPMIFVKLEENYLELRNNENGNHLIL